MLGSLLLLMLASAALGRLAGLLLPLGWAAGAAVTMTRVGEQMVLRAACGFHRPSPAQSAALKAAWSAALRVTGTDAGDVELYVQTARVPNAYAAGGRSVAVTSRVLEDYATGLLPAGQLVALLVHELGHHVTGATRPMLLVAWLTTPWRLTTRLLTNLSSTLAGRQHRRGALGAVVVGLAVAVIRTARHGQWMAGGVLVFVAVAAVFGPLANAAISRRSEYAADRFAADHGLALELAAALHALKGGGREAPRSLRRMWATHPSVDRRIAALLTAEERSRRRPSSWRPQLRKECRQRVDQTVGCVPESVPASFVHRGSARFAAVHISC
jgi:STE24 endopeptidase